MPVYTHDAYTMRLPESHRFPMHRYRAVRDALAAILRKPATWEPPPNLGSFGSSEASPSSSVQLQSLVPIDIRADSRRATREEAELVHERNYVDAFEQGRIPTKALGFPWSAALVERTYRILGGTLSAVEDVLLARAAAVQHSFVAGNLAGGTHHAFPASAEGFCVYNDLAVAAKYAQALVADSDALKLQMHPTVVIIDVDVHQGNGTAACLGNDPSVVTFSLHSEKNYPFGESRRESMVERNVGNDVGEAEYLAALEDGLSEVEERLGGPVLRSKPNAIGEPPPLVLFQAGVDPLAEDRLGKLKLSRATLWKRNAMVLEWCRRRSAMIVVTMGGGYPRTRWSYSRPIDYSVKAHCDVYLQAAGAVAAV
eukprot:g15938.t1